MDLAGKRKTNPAGSVPCSCGYGPALGTVPIRLVGKWSLEEIRGRACRGVRVVLFYVWCWWGGGAVEVLLFRYREVTCCSGQGWCGGCLVMVTGW